MKKLSRFINKVRNQPSHKASARQGKKNQVLFILAMVLIIVSAVLLAIHAGSSYIDTVNSAKNPEIILFEGKDCDHCANVDSFIEKNKVEEKMLFTRLEVANNEVNVNLLNQKARICGLNTSQIGIPFLWDGGHCVLGDVDVVQFFKDKLAAQIPKI